MALKKLLQLVSLIGAVFSACFDNGDKEIGGSCYKFVPQKLTFADAQYWCHYQNPVTSSYLAYVPNQFTSNFLASYARSAFETDDGNFWIGLSRKSSSSPWIWDNGQPLGFSNFGGQLGQNFAAESIVNAKWNAFGINDKNFFVCSYDPQAPPTFGPPVTDIPVSTVPVSTEVPPTPTVVPSSTSYPSPLCAYPFTGKIATVFEMKKDTANVTLAEAFVKNYLYNSPNYNFADVTQAINVPYGSTNQYGTSILNFGDARSLTDLQKNIDVLYNSSTSTSVAEVEEGLSWIENNIDPPAAGSIAIVIVVGFNNDNNPGGTYFVKNDLVAEGYQFMAVSLGGDLRNIVDNLDWYFQVNQLNGQDVANQISYILCNL